MGFLDKAVTKVLSSAIKAGTKAVAKSPARNAIKATQKAAPKVTKSTDIVRSTTPTSPFVSAAAPRFVPSTRVMPPARLAIEAPRVPAGREVVPYRTATPPVVRPTVPPTVPPTTPPIVPPTGGAGAGATGGESSRNIVARGLSKITPRGTLETVGGLAPFAVDAVEAQGVDVPSWLETAANVASIASGGSLAQKGFGKKGFINKDVRSAFGAANKRGKAGMAFSQGVLPAFGAQQIYDTTTNRLFSNEKPVAPAAEAAGTEEQVLGPLPGSEVTAPGTGLTPEQEIRSMIDGALSRLDSGNGTADDAAAVASGEQAILDTKAEQAFAELEAAYGGPDAVDAAVAANDPILMQEIAGIQADYQAAQGQIKSGYAAALAQVEGYQSQADQLMRDVAAEQMAAYEAAAGSAMEPVSTGIAGEQAAAAGVSNTALGGAGVTGAALARSLAGAAASQAAADRLALGTDLSGQLATGRLTQADLEAALSRDVAAATANARVDSAKRAADERARAAEQKRTDTIRIAELKYQAALDKQAEATRKAENEAARKQRIQELKVNAEIDLANKYAAMTPAERASYKGSVGSKKFTAPSWYGKADTRDPGTAVAVPGHSAGKVTVGDVQNVTDLLDSYLMDPSATDPVLAKTYWPAKYAELDTDALAILRAKKRPVTAAAMYKELFGSTPTK